MSGEVPEAPPASEDREVKEAGKEDGRSVKRLIAEDGSNARNLLVWRVPHEPRGGASRRARQDAAGKGSRSPKRSGRPPTGQSSQTKRSELEISTSVRSPATASTSSSRAASSPSALKQRVYRYLHRMVHRAVDELYYFCEAEGSVSHCEEAAKALHSCGRDFDKLVERIHVQRRSEREREGKSRVDSELTALSWEVRKSRSGVGPSDDSVIIRNALERMDAEMSRASDLAASKEESQSAILVATAKRRRKKALSAHAAPWVPKYADDQGPDGAGRDDASSSKGPPLGDPQKEEDGATAVPPKQAGFTMSSTCKENLAPADEEHRSDDRGAEPTAPHARVGAPSSSANNASVAAELAVPCPEASCVSGHAGEQEGSRSGQGHRSVRSSDEAADGTKAVERMSEDDLVQNEAEEREAIWQAAEAWVEASAMAEDEAWKSLALTSSTTSDPAAADDAKLLHGIKSMAPATLELECGGCDGAASQPKIDIPFDAGKVEGSSESPESDDERSSDSSSDSTQSETSSLVGQPLSAVSPANSCFSLGDDPARRLQAYSSDPDDLAIRSRTLHDKLSSPDRYKRRSPAEMKARLDERHRKAAAVRAGRAASRAARSRLAAQQQKDAEAARAGAAEEVMSRMQERLLQAGERRRDAIAYTRLRAANENSKVQEVSFIQTLTAETLAAELQAQLGDLDSRIQSARARKNAKLADIRASQRKRAHKAAAQLSAAEMQREVEAEARWNRLQLRLKQVEERRQRRAEMVARSEQSSDSKHGAPDVQSQESNLPDAPGPAGKEGATPGAGGSERVAQSSVAAAEGGRVREPDHEVASVLEGQPKDSLRWEDASPRESKPGAIVARSTMRSEPSIPGHANAQSTVQIPANSSRKKRTRKLKQQLRAAGDAWAQSDAYSKHRDLAFDSLKPHKALLEALSTLPAVQAQSLHSSRQSIEKSTAPVDAPKSKTPRRKAPSPQASGVDHGRGGPPLDNVDRLRKLCNVLRAAFRCREYAGGKGASAEAAGSAEDPADALIHAGLLRLLLVPQGPGESAERIDDAIIEVVHAALASSSLAREYLLSDGRGLVALADAAIEALVRIGVDHQHAHISGDAENGDQAPSARGPRLAGQRRQRGAAMKAPQGAAQWHPDPSLLQTVSSLTLLLRHLPSERASSTGQVHLVRYLSARSIAKALSMALASQQQLASTGKNAEILLRLLSLLDAVTTLPFSKCTAVGTGPGEFRDPSPALTVADLQTGVTSSRGPELAASVRSLLDDEHLIGALMTCMTAAVVAGNLNLRSGQRHIDTQVNRPPRTIIEQCNCGFRVLASIGRLDHERLQAGVFGGGDATGSPGAKSCLEYQHLCGKLMSALGLGVEFGSDGAVASAEAEQCLDLIITFIGYACLENDFAKEQLRWGSVSYSGESQSILTRLLRLPFAFYSEPRRMKVLFPTLILAGIDNRENRDIMAKEIDLSLLGRWLKRETTDLHESVVLSWRIPEVLWQRALCQFAN